MALDSSQYDNIVTSYNNLYDNLESLPCGQIEEANLQAAVQSHITGKRVLELGCGSGHYSRRLLKWGASFVLGVDISAGMIEEARARAKKINVGDRLSYHVADVSTTPDLSSSGGPFDLVVGTWLLNYASSAEEMEGMWRTIARNLRPGGLFFGLTIPPPLSGKDEIDRALLQEWAKYGTSGYVTGEVAGGFAVHMVLGMPGSSNRVEFDNYYLRTEVFEESAKAGGLSGALGWLPSVLPESLRERFPGGYWNGVVLNPHFRICCVKK